MRLARKNEITRPRRGGCAGSRICAVDAARARPEPHRSAAGARGARAAGSPAAAPETRTRPGQRLQSIVLPLPGVPSPARHAAAGPLCLRHGARSGGGGFNPGEDAQRLVHEGTLCVAAAAVPRLAGTGA